MKRTILASLLTALIAVGAAAQVRTVTDYYLAMPDDQYSTDIEGNKIRGKAALERYRRSLIKIEDKRNGYLRLEGPWEGWAEIALFKKKDGSYIVGHAETGCGPACSGFVKFYTFAGGKWTDVTSQVFDEPSDDEVIAILKSNKIDIAESGTDVYYVLPRIGTTLKMACNMCREGGSSDVVLTSFRWNGAKFAAVK